MCMRVWSAEWLYRCVHTLSNDYATIYGSCICITCGAKVRHLRTIPIYVRRHVIINRYFDNNKSRNQHWPITARFMCTKYTFLGPYRSSYTTYGVSYVGNHISLYLNISSCTIETVHVRYMRLIYKPTLIRKTFIFYFVVMLLCRLYIRGEEPKIRLYMRGDAP